MRNAMQDALLKAGVISDKDVQQNDNCDVHYSKSGKKAIKLFSQASDDKPMFARVTVLHEDIDTGKMETEWKGLVACTGVETVTIEDDYFDYDETRAKFRAMEDGEILHNIQYGYHLKKSYGFPGTNDNFIIDEIVESTPELMTEYESMLDNITAKVFWCDFEETKDDALCSIIKGTECEEVISKVRTFDDVSRWMLENHPAQYMGYSTSMSNGNFLATAVPCVEYDARFYKTREGRMEYARKEAERLGCQVGEPNYDKLNEVLNQRKKMANRQFDDIVINGPNSESEYQKE